MHHTFKLRFPTLVALIVMALTACMEPSTLSSGDTPTSARILNDVGQPVIKARVISAITHDTIYTDTTGAWKRPISSFDRPDTFRLLIDSLSAGTITLAAGERPVDLRIVWHRLQGTMPSYQIYASPKHLIRVVLLRRSGDRDSVTVPIDSGTQSFSAGIPNIAGDSSQFGEVYAELLDSLGVAARWDRTPYNKQPLRHDIAKYYPKRLAIEPSFVAYWRYRDTVSVVAHYIDTSLVASIEWSTSLDTIWRKGTTSFLVRTLSSNDPPLVVRNRIASREGRILLTNIVFRTGQPDDSWNWPTSPLRISTPPRMTVALSQSCALGESFKLSTTARDTLGGKVVLRKLVWSWGDTVDIQSDTQSVRLPIIKIAPQLTAKVLAVDDDGETTFVNIGLRAIEPPPKLGFSEATTRSFRVSWDTSTVIGYDKFRIHIRDGINDSLLIDTLVEGTLKSITIPRRFLARTLLLEARFEGASVDSGRWTRKLDSLPSGPFNPYWIRIYPYYLYGVTWNVSNPGETVHFLNGEQLQVPSHPDTSLVVYYRTQNNSNGTYYQTSMGWNQAPHVKDSVIVEIQTVDSVVMVVKEYPSWVGANLAPVLGWRPRKVGSGRQVFRLADLERLDAITGAPSGDVSDGSQVFGSTPGFGLYFVCANDDSVCNTKTTAVLIPSIEID